MSREGSFMFAPPSELSRAPTQPESANHALGHSTEKSAARHPGSDPAADNDAFAPGLRTIFRDENPRRWLRAGDVAMLAAELVGESGAVVGIDRSEAAILAARARAASFSRGSRRPWRVYRY